MVFFESYLSNKTKYLFCIATFQFKRNSVAKESFFKNQIVLIESIIYFAEQHVNNADFDILSGASLNSTQL